MQQTESAQLIDIAYKDKKRGPMLKHQQCQVSCDAGVQGDVRGKPGRRQVTVLCREAWQLACDELQVDLPWTVRRANLLVSGLTLDHSSIGKIIEIGDVKLEITRETDPCHRMEQQQTGLINALKPDWRGGVCCKVLQGGHIEVNAQVTLR